MSLQVLVRSRELGNPRILADRWDPHPSRFFSGPVSLPDWCLKEASSLSSTGVGGNGVGVFRPPRPPTKRRKKGNLDKKSDRRHAWRSRYQPIYLPAHSRFFPLISPLQMPGTKALQTYTYCQAHGPTQGCLGEMALKSKKKVEAPRSSHFGKRRPHSETWQLGWSCPGVGA